MKIIVTVDSLSSAMTGIGRYTWELLHGLASHPRISDLKLYENGGFVKAPVLCEQMINESRPSQDYISKVLRFGYRLISPAFQWYKLKKYSDYIFHATNYYLPNVTGRTVVTIHDLSVLRFPEFHPSERVSHLRKAIPDAIKRADLLLTDSEFVRREILSLYENTVSKVVAIPLACGSEFCAHDKDKTSPFLESHGLRHGSYSLFVGTLEPRKNIVSMIKAYRKIDRELRLQYPLVLAGLPGWHSKEIHKEINDAREEGWCKYIGYVPKSSLPLLYSGARCFYFPSIYEGFGLPVLEAMASAVPVITTINSSMQEILTDAGLYVEPFDIEGQVTHLETLLSNDSFHAMYASAVLERSKAFSWQSFIDSTVKAYSSIV